MGPQQARRCGLGARVVKAPSALGLPAASLLL
jgi:hypothetical protein